MAEGFGTCEVLRNSALHHDFEPNCCSFLIDLLDFGVFSVYIMLYTKLNGSLRYNGFQIVNAFNNHATVGMKLHSLYYAFSSFFIAFLAIFLIRGVTLLQSLPPNSYYGLISLFNDLRIIKSIEPFNMIQSNEIIYYVTFISIIAFTKLYEIVSFERSCFSKITNDL